MVILACLSIRGEVLGDRTHIDLHSPVKSIVEEEVVCHADPVGFHGMALAIVVVPYIALEGEKNNQKIDATTIRHFQPVMKQV